ncbi:DeoR/GlpR family DNA-binding transcription regulator [uncultured Cetobacterium sp.]|uniref:DeoR/GlpR family DNA-binding transcription regulator n=1 Tax=uncultured Cetobacterium sp. TaxID=527638 RepID=UPI0026363E0A|nr:DeoR/GlpR family DNA-binding transcription regulator [uncultured Cetobacterium sp.]
MLKEERRSEILKELEERKVVKVLELSNKYDVGIETIRRDLDCLEKLGKVRKVYGGAELPDENSEIINYAERLTIEVDEKNEIVEKAVALIEEGDSISLNDGSTTLFLAKLLKKRFEKLTILTNSLDIAQELLDAKGYDVIMAGGFLSHEERAFFGVYSEAIISNFIIDKAFIGVSGVSLCNGITDMSTSEANIQKKFIENSKESFILVNSSKIEKDSLVKVCPLDKVNTFISDSKVSGDIRLSYKNEGIEIL